MKNVYALIALLGTAFTLAAQNPTFHSYEAETILGDTISLSQYYGKKVLVVNTASFCAYTPQFEDLENLYLQYKQNNFEIIGFPCNDFANQDPHSDSTILDFCTDNYNVTFQMMSKVQIVTGDTAPVYKWLQRADLNGVQNAHVAWNFNKFLIDETGHWVKHFTSSTLPGDTAITNWILSPSVISGINDVKPGNWIKFTSGNVVSNQLELSVSSNKPDNLSLQLFAMDGRYIAELFSGSVNGVQPMTFSLATLPACNYLLKASKGAAVQTEKFLLVR